jgi:hypothetical protein
MRILKRRGDREHEHNQAVLDRPETRQRKPVVDDFEGTDAELSAEIEKLAEANQANPHRETERRLMALRHIAGMRALRPDGDGADFPTPESGRLPEEGSLPEFAAEDLTPGLVRAAILRDGFILVRGLVDRDDALRFGEQIDRAFEEREKFLEDQPQMGTTRSSFPGRRSTRRRSRSAHGSAWGAVCSPWTPRCSRHRW